MRRHDQGNHHLHAIGTFVLAVAELALVLKRRITLKISAGQIVEKDIKPEPVNDFETLAIAIY